MKLQALLTRVLYFRRNTCMPRKTKRSSSSFVDNLLYIRAHALRNDWTRFVTLLLFFSFMLGTALTLTTIQHVNAATVRAPAPTAASVAKDLNSATKRLDAIEAALRDLTKRLAVVEDRTTPPPPPPTAEATSTSSSQEECVSACKVKGDRAGWDSSTLNACIEKNCSTSSANEVPPVQEMPLKVSPNMIEKAPPAPEPVSTEQCIANCKGGTGSRAPTTDEVNRCIAIQCRVATQKEAAPTGDLCKQKCIDQMSSLLVPETDPAYTQRLNRCLAVNCATNVPTAGSGGGYVNAQ